MAKVALVIDGNSPNLDLMYDLLEFSRYQVHTAKSLQEAKEIIHNQTALDLVFLNCTLPDGRGISLIKELRQKFPATVIILATSKDQDEVAPEVPGVDKVLYRPFDVKNLQEDLQHLLK
jgi:DNA-binding response OmpR family regulator